MSTRPVAGVDGCPGGWIAILESGDHLDACVYTDWPSLMRSAAQNSLIAVDIPIGLPATGARACDLEARRYLGAPRGSSVFRAPVRACLIPGSYEELSARHRRIDGRGLSKQAFNLLPKIREVDRYLFDNIRDRPRIREVHPEVSFTVWNAGCALRHRKTHAMGRSERERLIDAVWKEARERLWAIVQGKGCRRDDLNDAFAALWSARRIARGIARELPNIVTTDPYELRMQISA